jgi:hypothetical protein
MLLLSICRFGNLTHCIAEAGAVVTFTIGVGGAGVAAITCALRSLVI